MQDGHRLNWSRRTSLVRPPFYGPGSIRRRKRFSNSHIRKIAKNCHERTAPQPATVLKKMHRRGSPVTLLNTSGTRPTVCSPGSPSAAPATFPADNCCGQVRLTIAQPVPMQETAGCAENTQTNFLAAGSGNPSAGTPKLPKCPENDTFRPLHALTAEAATDLQPRRHTTLMNVPPSHAPSPSPPAKTLTDWLPSSGGLQKIRHSGPGSSHDCTS